MYKCIRSFTDHNGKHHSYGFRISSIQELDAMERRNYEEEQDDISSSISAATGILMDDITPSMPDFSSSDSESSFDGFDGGDTGGGGASGDW